VDPPGPRPNIAVSVATSPGGGSLYVNGQPAGVDGQIFHRPKGTAVTIHCVPTSSSYMSGDVRVTFDGRSRGATCVMERKSKCVKELHNPYANCPD
jgi:hypothetical protein